MLRSLVLACALAVIPPGQFPEEPEFPTFAECCRQHELAEAFLRWLDLQCEARVFPDMEVWDAWRGRQRHVVAVWQKIRHIVQPPFGPQFLLDCLRDLVGEADYEIRAWPDPAPSWFNPDRMLPPIMPRAITD